MDTLLTIGFIITLIAVLIRYLPAILNKIEAILSTFEK